MRRTVLCLILGMSLLCADARAHVAAVVTPETYTIRHTQVAGQRVFEHAEFVLDVYEADFWRDGSSLAFDVYPRGEWDTDREVQVAVGGQQVDWPVEVELVEGAHPVYAYSLRGPALQSAPERVTITVNGQKVEARVRGVPFERNQSAYYLSFEVGVAQAVYPALSEADDPMEDAARFLPEGARLLDCSVSEDCATIVYRQDNERVMVDYYKDGRVEKMIRADGERKIYVASSESEMAYSPDIGWRSQLGHAAALRPEGRAVDAMIRKNGLNFRVEEYHLDGEILTVDWTVDADRDMLVMPGYLHTEVENMERADYALIYALMSIIPLNASNGRRYEGSTTVELTQGAPERPFRARLATYFLEARAPVVAWDALEPGMRGPLLLDMGGGIYEMAESVDQDGSTSMSYDGSLDELAQVAAMDKAGYFHMVEPMELAFSVGVTRTDVGRLGRG